MISGRMRRRALMNQLQTCRTVRPASFARARFSAGSFLGGGVLVRRRTRVPFSFVEHGDGVVAPCSSRVVTRLLQPSCSQPNQITAVA